MRATRQIIGHGVIEVLEIVLVLTTNGALGIPRGLVSTWGLVTVEDILESAHNLLWPEWAKRPPPIPRFNQVAVNMLYSLPQELLIEVVECCDHLSQRNLSLVSRRLRILAQRTMFRELSFPKLSVTRIHNPERLPGILANTQLLTYIHSLTISMIMAPSILKIEEVEFSFSVLARFPHLKALRLESLSLSPPMVDHFCALATERPLDVTFHSCSSPYDAPIPTLGITRIKSTYTSYGPHSFPLFDRLLKASVHALHQIYISQTTPALLAIGEIPNLTQLTIAARTFRAEDLKTVLHATPALQELRFLGPIEGACALPRAVVPRLRRMWATPHLVAQLVPGRPISSIVFAVFPAPDSESLIAAVRAASQSTATVTSLSLPLRYQEASTVSQVMKVALESTPHLHHFTCSYVPITVSSFSFVLYDFTSVLISGGLCNVGASHSVSLITRGRCLGF